MCVMSDSSHSPANFRRPVRLAINRSADKHSELDLPERLGSPSQVRLDFSSCKSLMSETGIALAL